MGASGTPFIVAHSLASAVRSKLSTTSFGVRAKADAGRAVLHTDSGARAAGRSIN
jgi:hypothetical protein